MENENMINENMGDGNMNDDNKNANKKKNAVKIIVPIIIVLIVAGIWFVRNSEKAPVGEPDIMNEDFALHVTEAIDLDKLKSYGIPIMLDFGSESCPPCREMAPTIEKLNRDLQGKAIIKYMDVWENPEFAEDYPVRVIPTQLFFDKDGNPYVPEDPESSGMLIYTSKETEEHVFTAHEGGLTEEQLLEIFTEMGMEE